MFLCELESKAVAATAAKEKWSWHTRTSAEHEQNYYLFSTINKNILTFSHTHTHTHNRHFWLTVECISFEQHFRLCGTKTRTERIYEPQRLFTIHSKKPKERGKMKAGEREWRRFSRAFRAPVLIIGNYVYVQRVLWMWRMSCELFAWTHCVRQKRCDPWKWPSGRGRMPQQPSGVWTKIMVQCIVIVIIKQNERKEWQNKQAAAVIHVSSGN